MFGKNSALLIIGILVLAEVVREVYVLKCLGFQPKRFAEWLGSDSLVCETEVA